MAINTSNIATLLRPGLTKIFDGVFGDVFGVEVPAPPPEWMKQYEIERRKVLNKRSWERWLAQHTPTARERLERLNPDGCEPGRRPRGWRPEERAFFVKDIVPAYAYYQKWGRKPKKEMLLGPRRKYIDRVTLLDGRAHASP